MAKPGVPRARQEAKYRRRRQALLLISCLAMGLLGSMTATLGRSHLPNLLGDGKHFKQPQNILLVGVDDNYDPSGRRIRNQKARTDTIMLVTVRPAQHSLHVLSIPRDTQVLIPRYGTEKINAAHALGGIERTKDVVEALLGVTVDHTVEISLKGAADFLDQLGGVDVYIEQPLHYEDHTAKLLIDLKQGWQRLDGRAAVGYARFRHDAMGDIGRVARQQNLMHAIEQKFMNPMNWWRIPQLASNAGRLFKSDITARDLTELASFTKSRPAISYTTLPGDFGYSGYWIPNHGRIVALMESLSHEEKATLKAGGGSPSSVEILYGSHQDQAATKLASALGDRGITVVRTAPVSTAMAVGTRVIGRNGNATLDPALAALMPHAPWQLSDDASPYSADYTVVIGPDFR